MAPINALRQPDDQFLPQQLEIAVASSLGAAPLIVRQVFLAAFP